MTTKFAAFLRLIFPNSVITSMFLLLILTGSCIDILLTPLPRSAFGFLDSLVADFAALFTGKRRMCQLLVKEICIIADLWQPAPLSQHPPG